jgi:integrase
MLDALPPWTAGSRFACSAGGACPALMNIGACAQVQSWLPHTHKGQAFELAFKHRQLDSGPEVYRACDSLQQTISRLYRQAGIKQGSSHSGRRSLAAKVLAATGDVEMVQTILGHACLDHSKPYLTVDIEVIRRAFELALA